MYLVAIAFVINIANTYGKVADKDAGFWNLGMGLLILFIVLVGLVQSWYDDGTFWWASGILLFGLTYLYLGISKLANLDGRGLGWFCLFVVFYLPAPTWQVFQSGDVILGVIYIVWAILWLLFWIALGLQKGGTAVGKAILTLQWIVLIFTLFLPSILFMNGWWPPFS
jgi:hypothetical protein